MLVEQRNVVVRFRRGEHLMEALLGGSEGPKRQEVLWHKDPREGRRNQGYPTSMALGYHRSTTW
ncbi:MAG: hypothetical protein M3138_07120 [Actinomycetota bacterium]|nr:hypothetical protein [Actinomycetota bacterium]